MEIVLLILYLAVLACQIALLIRCVRKPSRRGWILLYGLEIFFLGIAIVLTRYFDALPGHGMMPGLAWFAETLFSLGAAVVYGGMLLVSLLAGGLTLLKRGGKGRVNRRKLLRWISLVMLIVAVIFVICAMCCPTCGSVFYIGPFRIGAAVWRKFYAAYVVVMIGLFIASFFVSKKKT